MATSVMTRKQLLAQVSYLQKKAKIDYLRRPIAGGKVKQMTPKERRIKRLWLAGRTSAEIAAEIEMTKRMVQGILNDLGL